MSYAVQIRINNLWTQYGITTADITLETGIVADKFVSCKSSNDTIYIMCYKYDYGYSDTNRARIIKIDSIGNKTITVLNWNYTAQDYERIPKQIKLNRAEDILYISAKNNNVYENLYAIEISKIVNGSITLSDVTMIFNAGYGSPGREIIFSIYRDLYLWIKNYKLNNTGYIGIYRQTNPYSEILSLDVGSAIISLSVDINNQCWVVTASNIHKVLYDVSLTKATTAFATNFFQYVKESKIDKWGDLILITNNLTTSTLIKLKITGTPEIINIIDLQGIRYGLSTDKDGNVYYQSSLNTYMIEKGTASGQIFDTLENHTIIRASGNNTYNNNPFWYDAGRNA